MRDICKRTLAALLLTFLLLIMVTPLAACDSTYADSVIRERDITLEDGRTITCITYAGYEGGYRINGIDCDWESG